MNTCLDRVLQATTPKIFVREQERKPLAFPHYTHHRHGSPSSSVDNHIEQNSIYRPLLHAIKVQRHSDPYSIKWITEGPHRDIDAGECLHCKTVQSSDHKLCSSRSTLSNEPWVRNDPFPFEYDQSCPQFFVIDIIDLSVADLDATLSKITCKYLDVIVSLSLASHRCPSNSSSSSVCQLIEKI